MRIAVNGNFYSRPNTGSGQYLRELLPALARCDPGNEYIVVIPQSERIGNGLRKMAEDAAPIWLYPERVGLARIHENLGKVWFEQVAFGRACRREHAALAHVPYFASPVLPPVPSVVTIHDLIPLILPLYRGSRVVRLYTRLAAMAARRADAVIADSESTKRDVIRYLGIPARRVHVIYLAAASRYHPVQESAQLDAIRNKYALPSQYLLYLGGFDQRKNIRTIIEAFSLLPEFYAAGYRLALAGVCLGPDSDLFPSPQRIAREVGVADDAIRHLGWVAEKDKPALLSGAAMFLFPSLYEGFGLPPLEAMACGTPVICSNAASLPEIVGSAGMLVEPSNPVAWAEAIRALLTEVGRRAELREQGVAQAAKFSWSRAAQETLRVYQSVI
jgi:glycosyltransferase involved in cell wall biosynthesis